MIASFEFITYYHTPIARIAKGKGTGENRIAVGMATGKINGNESIIQGITQDNTSSIQKIPSIYLFFYGFT